MPKKTQTYQLDYFRRGEFYNGPTSDFRHFTTLDYNMESYVGIVGVGIIDGWTIEQTTGLTVKVLPGKGIINGYFTESPYTVKRRSDMVAGDREVEIFDETGVIPDKLTPAERVTYVSVIQLYDPTFNPVGAILNYYVKTVIPTEITLYDNDDNYIFAKLPDIANYKPYPELNDLTVLIDDLGNPPNRDDYSTYGSYKAAKDIYDAKLETVHEYQWYLNSNNHYTAVDFEKTLSRISSTYKVLLGKVVTRNGIVSEIDITGIDSLVNLRSEIEKFTKEFLVNHVHGGSKAFDPPKVRLETDIRDTVLSDYNTQTGRAIYNVLENDETSTDIGHKHTYKIDSDGNGNTLEQIGSGVNSHFHKISNSAVSNPESSALFVESHTHTILAENDKVNIWDSDSSYVIYVNGDEFGDETSTNISTNTTTKQIIFDNGISVTTDTYSISFEIFSETYSYTGKAYTIFEFVLSMWRDFYIVYNEKFNEIYNSLPEGIVYDRSQDDPFWFWTKVLNDTVETTFTFSDGTQSQITTFLESNNDELGIKGFSDLQTQSEIGQSLLKHVGDIFTFTPEAANNINIVLQEKAHTDIVEIEILGNVEVTGVLRAENIFYINADKISTGEFDIERIPFISHIGRLLEQFLPFKYSFLSNDGFRYTVNPNITDLTLSHYHRMSLNREGTGVTTDTLIGEEVVFYATGSHGESIYVAHYHPVEDYKVTETTQDGLTEWLNNSNTVSSTSTHTHNVVFPVQGDNKTVYSMLEDVDGNIYAGTSDGFMMIPAQATYLFVINGYDYYEFGNNLWQLFLNAKSEYEKETELLFTVTNELYEDQIEQAEDNLVDDGDSVIMYGNSAPDRIVDETLIKKVSNFELPNFKYVIDKDPNDVLDTETIIGVKRVEISDGEEVDTATWTTEDETSSPTKELVTVERSFNGIPIWSIASKTITVPSEAYILATSQIDFLTVGSDLIAKNTDLNQNVNQVWNDVDIPFEVGIIRRILKVADGGYWAATDNGVIVSRSYSNGDIFETVALPGANPDIKDIVEGQKGYIFVVSEAGVFETHDGGKVWSNVFDIIGGFDQITRDYSLDKSDTVSGHYHMASVDSLGNGFLSESIGTGTPHVHQVTAWDIGATLGHTHIFVVTLYVTDNSKIIWKSIDNGVTWTNFGALPSGEIGSISAAFGLIFIGQIDGTYKTSNGQEWVKVLSKRAYSFQWNYNLSGLMIGTDNVIYTTMDGSVFSTTYTFDGMPMAILTDESVRRYFGYAYSNKSKEMHFKEAPELSNTTLALVDFDKWLAENGQWNKSSPYDIYIDNKRVLSTKFNEDKRELYGYNFEVDSENGIIDFSAASKLKEAVKVGSLTINVESVNGFLVGDRILIVTDFQPGPVPSRTSTQTAAQYEDILNEYYRSLQSIEDTTTFAVIATISGTEFTLTSRLEKDINLPATVSKITDLDGNSSVLVNIYESILSNIGTLIHDQVEDGLSNYTDGRPYKFNDTYLSNLLQLTQAVRYVYPDINSEYINDMFYDFRYQSVSHPTYPPITDFIDTLTSNIYSQKFYDTDFSRVFAKAVNKILIGYGNFAGNIFIATDLGLFWAKIEDNYEANWFYVSGLPYAVYDVIIFIDKIIVATSSGSFSSLDMTTWVTEAPLFSQYSAYSLGLRWADQEVIVVPDHDAVFVSETDSSDKDGVGYITAQNGAPYNILRNNQGIKITNAGDKNGNYIIQEITDIGHGYGSGLTVSKSFEGPDGLKSNISITMGTWWQQWDGDSNETNINLTNTMLIGGQGRIAYSINNIGSEFAWAEAIISVSDFIGKDFTSISNGLMLLSAPGLSVTSRKNYILQSKDVGRSWDIFRSFESVEGIVDKVIISSENNTIVTVSYIKPENYKYVDGVLTGRMVSIFDKDNITSLYTSYVVWNETRDGKDIVTIYGNEAGNYAQGNKIVILPFKINTMLETTEHSLFFGSNQGIYYDANTVVNNYEPTGTIRDIGYNGVVQQIDISGNVISMSVNPATNHTVFSVDTNTVVSTNEAIGKKLYITDADPVEEYEIVANNGTTPGGESTIEINALIISDYVGKRFVLVGESSRVYVNFDLFVATDQFKDGKFYITSNENDNIGQTYNIISNSTTYIDLTTSIIPSSTFLTASDDQSLQVGQSISLLDSTGNIILWVSLDRQAKDNDLKGLEFKLDNSSSQAAQLNDLIIISNTRNSITLDAGNINMQLDSVRRQAITLGVPESQLQNLSIVSVFQEGDAFRLNGILIRPLSGFSNKQTTTESDHKHEVEMVNEVVSGKIATFGFMNASYVDINVSDTDNFDLEIVQRQGDLFENAKIVFTNDDSYNLEYESEVISHTATSIRVRIKSESYWNFTAYSDLAISVGWDWKINANNYGYTKNITYKDFVVKQSFITEQINRGDTTIIIEETSGIIVGDKVKLQDDTLSSETNIVASIVDIQTLSVVNPISRTYYESRNPQLRVLRNTFSNTHTHQIRNNEVELFNITSYLNNGYPSMHAHRVLALIADVSKILNRNGEIIVVGSSENIYSSSDNGRTWLQIADLNVFRDGDIPVTGISTASLDNTEILAGATNGRIFVQAISDGEVVRLIEPEVVI